MITADANTAVQQRALALGARDFAVKPFDSLEIQLRIKNLLESGFSTRS